MEQGDIDQLMNDFDDVVANVVAEKEGLPVTEVHFDFSPKNNGLLMFSIAEDSLPFADDQKSIITWRTDDL